MAASLILAMSDDSSPMRTRSAQTGAVADGYCSSWRTRSQEPPVRTHARTLTPPLHPTPCRLPYITGYTQTILEQGIQAYVEVG